MTYFVIYHLLFLIVSLGIYLPLSPLISKIGISICPILRNHGFWYGCQINLAFVLQLLAITTVLGFVIMESARRKLKDRWWLPEPSVLLGILFLGISMSAMIWFREQISARIGNTGSPYGQVISLVLIWAGSAAVFLQAAILDFCILRLRRSIQNPSPHPMALRKFLAEGWNVSMLVIAPLFVLSCFFTFSTLLFDQQVDGWDSIASQRPKVITASIGMMTWYLCFFVAMYLGRIEIQGRLLKQARALGHLRTHTPMSLERLALLSDVGQALNHSAEVLSEKTRLVSNFSKFVSDRLIEVVVASDELDLEGHCTQCAIMMTDLRGFTKISQSLPPSSVVKMLNIYFEDMIQILNTHDIVIDKFIGDGLLAYISTGPSRNPRDACKALVTASLNMLEQLNKTNDRLAAENLPRLQLGVGLHFGDVVLGAMGSKTRMQYTIIGDSVNRTARIESLCKDLRTPLVISSEVVTHLDDSSRALFSGPHSREIKGIEGAATVFTLIPFDFTALRSAS